MFIYLNMINNQNIIFIFRNKNSLLILGYYQFHFFDLKVILKYFYYKYKFNK